MSEHPEPHQLPVLEEKVAYCVSLVEEKKAEEVLVFDLRDISSVTDYFLLCHGSSGRQVQAIADHLLEMAKKRGLRPLGVEGYPEAQWILLDLGDLIVHVFYEETRRFYDLERLWGHAPQIYPPHAKALT
ncbi:MAG: ribosome silencing factor [bacterium]|nr:ribosome silencing factor [bacterium]